MKLTKIEPIRFQKEIKYIYLLKNDSTCEMPEGQEHLPDGTFELIMSYGSPVFHSRTTGGFTRRDDVLFIGGYKKLHRVKYSGCIHLIGVVFDQAHIACIVGDRMNHSSELLYPARYIFDQDVEFLAEQLRHVQDMQIIRFAVENYLSRLIPPTPTRSSSKAGQAMNMMLSNSGNIKVKTLANELCMSERNFRRVFGETTGYSPREMLSIIRAKKLIHLLKGNKSVREAARQLAYYDAPHVIHDFKVLTGTTPACYLSRMNIIDLSFFEKSEYAG